MYTVIVPGEGFCFLQVASWGFVMGGGGGGGVVLDEIDTCITVDERNNLVVYSRRFCQCGTKLEWFATDFWYLLDCFHSWFLHFSWIENSSETIKTSKPFALSVCLGIVTGQIYERQYK